MQEAGKSESKLRLELTDVLGSDLNDSASIDLSDTASSRRYRNEEQVSRAVTISGIRCSPSALCRVWIAPVRYRPRRFFIALEEGKIAERTISFAVQPKKVAGISAPRHRDLMPALRRVLVERVYNSFAPLQKACLLNIAVKAASTIPGGQKSCLDHWVRIVEVRQDRLFARTTAALEETAAHSPLFQKTTGLLHDGPPGYHRISSYKTRDPHGSLQLTFFRRGESGNDYVVDADIDEARGIEHLFEVMRNELSAPTNPYNVREVLIAGQGLDPGYRFEFG